MAADLRYTAVPCTMSLMSLWITNQSLTLLDEELDLTVQA